MPDEVLHRVLGAAHAAPSVGLSQPWDFVLVCDVDTRAAFRNHVHQEREVFARQLDEQQASIFARIKVEGVLESSLGIVVTYDPQRGAPAVLGRHAIAEAGLYSVCLAIQNLWLAATVEGPRCRLGEFLPGGISARAVGHPGPGAAGGLAVPRTGSGTTGQSRPRTAWLAPPHTAGGGPPRGTVRASGVQRTALPVDPSVSLPYTMDDLWMVSIHIPPTNYCTPLSDTHSSVTVVLNHDLNTGYGARESSR